MNERIDVPPAAESGVREQLNLYSECSTSVPITPECNRIEHGRSLYTGSRRPEDAHVPGGQIAAATYVTKAMDRRDNAGIVPEIERPGAQAGASNVNRLEGYDTLFSHDTIERPSPNSSRRLPTCRNRAVPQHGNANRGYCKQHSRCRDKWNLSESNSGPLPSDLWLDVRGAKPALEVTTSRARCQSLLIWHTTDIG